MVGLPAEDQSRHGLYTRSFSFGQALPAFPKMDQLHLVTVWVERQSHVLFGFNTNGTSCMIEYGFRFHKIRFVDGYVIERKGPLALTCMHSIMNHERNNRVQNGAPPS